MERAQETFENEGGKIPNDKDFVQINDGGRTNENRLLDHRSWMSKIDLKDLCDQLSLHVKKAWGHCARIYSEQQRAIHHYIKVAGLVLFVVVLFQNIETTRLSLFFWEVSAPKVVLFIVMLLVGLGFGYALGAKYRFRSD